MSKTKKNINHIFNIYRFERISQIRKNFHDWGFEISIKKYNLVLLIASLVIFISVTALANYLKVHIRANDFWVFVALLTIFRLISQSFSFYNQNKSYFILDQSKMLLMNKEFRVLRVFTKALESSVKSTIIYCYLILLPIYLGAMGALTPYVLYPLVLIPVLYFLVLNFLIFTISLSTFLLSKYMKLFFLKNSLYFVSYIITLVISFYIPYILLNVFLNSSFETMHLTNLIQGLRMRSMDDIFTTSIGAVGFIAIILLAIVNFFVVNRTYKILMKTDLLPYMDGFDSYHASYKVSPFTKSKKPFFIKDLLNLRRLNGWWWEHLGRTFIILACITGISIPLVDIFLSNNSFLYTLGFTILFSIYIYHILGDSLRMLLAVDQESKNLHLFTRKSISLWEVVSQKLKVYSLFVLLMTLLVFVYLLVITELNVLNTIFMLCVSLAFGLVSGIIQISTTALFPKINWEHYYELGQSKKAAFYNEVLNTALIVLFTLISTALFFVERQLSTDMVYAALSITVIFLFLTVACSYIFTMLFLKKIDFKEVFKEND
ncbi:hypothetical protein [Sediminibacillus massiliensis]|uniref:hypothetical protein n=1 Tax=Sediminibacillus massiliensis TaxID=1926277 RepID=UPI00098880EA|nr:hypothetical protein [Sediminibacillus massiliensis]